MKERIEPLPDYGDLLTLDDFAECVRTHELIDYDGHGYAANEREMDQSVFVQPSTFDRAALEPRWTHVMWFNR